MIINPSNNLTFLFEELTRKEQEYEKNENDIIFKDTLSVKNNTKNENELKRVNTVNEVNLAKEVENLNVNKEYVKNSATERYRIIEGLISSEEVLGLNINIFI